VSCATAASAKVLVSTYASPAHAAALGAHDFLVKAGCAMAPAMTEAGPFRPTYRPDWSSSALLRTESLEIRAAAEPTPTAVVNNFGTMGTASRTGYPHLHRSHRISVMVLYSASDRTLNYSTICTVRFRWRPSAGRIVEQHRLVFLFGARNTLVRSPVLRATRTDGRPAEKASADPCRTDSDVRRCSPAAGIRFAESNVALPRSQPVGKTCRG
jgi:hypothetical protein